MAEEVQLGGVELIVKADEASFQRAHKKGGQSLVDAAKKGGRPVREFGAIRPVGALGGRAGGAAAGAGGLAGFAGGAALAGGLAIGVVVAGFGIVAAASIKASKAFLQSGRNLSNLNASLARARARSDIGGLFRDLDRARIIGPTFERLNRITERLKNKAAPFVNFILVQAGRGLEKFATILDITSTSILSFSERFFAAADINLLAIQAAAGANVLGFGGMLNATIFNLSKDLREDLDELRKQLQELNDKNKPSDEFNILFLDALGQLIGGVPGRDLIPGAFPPGATP